MTTTGAISLKVLIRLFGQFKLKNKTWKKLHMHLMDITYIIRDKHEKQVRVWSFIRANLLAKVNNTLEVKWGGGQSLCSILF